MVRAILRDYLLNFISSTKMLKNLFSAIFGVLGVFGPSEFDYSIHLGVGGGH